MVKADDLKRVLDIESRPKSMSTEEFADMIGTARETVVSWVRLPESQRIPGFYVSNEKTKGGRMPKFIIWTELAIEWLANQQKVY